MEMGCYYYETMVTPVIPDYAFDSKTSAISSIPFTPFQISYPDCFKKVLISYKAL